MLLLVALSAAALLLSACGGSDGPPRASDTALDLRKIERGIVELQRENTPQAMLGRAHCPKDPVVRRGTRIRCTLEVEGEPVPFVVAVKQADDHTSSYSTAPAREFLLTRTIEKKLTDGLEPGAEADCGDRALHFYEVGTEIPCRARIPGRPFRRLSVVIKKPDGSFNVRIRAGRPNSTGQQVHLRGGSIYFVIPPGLQPSAPDPPRGSTIDAAAVLSLSEGNQIDLTQYHLDKPFPDPESTKSLRSLGAQVTRKVTAGGGKVVSRLGRSRVDGARGILLVVRPKPGRRTLTELRVVVRAREEFVIGCTFTPPNDDRLIRACKQLLDTVDLRPFRR